MEDLGKLLGQLHLAVAKDLLEKIERGEADDRIIDKATKFLKDNEIKYDKDLSDEHVERLSEAVIEIDDIPFEESERFKMVQ